VQAQADGPAGSSSFLGFLCIFAAILDSPAAGCQRISDVTRYHEAAQNRRVEVLTIRHTVGAPSFSPYHGWLISDLPKFISFNFAPKALPLNFDHELRETN
jgi:hypothetical protein